MTTRLCDQCGKHLTTHRIDARFCDESCRTHWKNEQRRKQGTPNTRVIGQDDGVGSRGGNVRSVQEAREKQGEQKPKRDWAGVIDEQIARTLLGTGFLHADDLDPLGVPPEHCNLKGTRIASFRNRGLMERTGVERKVSHVAANGRKAPIHRITKTGREVLTAGLGAERGISAGDARSPHRSLSAESGGLAATPQSAGDPSPEGAGRVTDPPVPSASVHPGGSPAVDLPQGSAAGDARLFELAPEPPRSAWTDSEAA